MKKKEWRQLVSKAAQGDGRAFEKLYNETCRSVYFMCLRLLGNEHNAQDAAQETYLTAYGKLTSLDDGANFPQWVNGIAVNICKRSFRQETNISLDERLEQGEQFADDDSFLPEDYVSDAEKRRVIMDIIDNRLSDTRRQTVILYYFNGLSTKEIARVMDCPEGTVTYRLSAARADIKEAVLIYENKHEERLHAIVPVPILTRILRAEAENTSPPDITLFLKPAINKTSAYTLQAGGKHTMMTLKTKIIAAVIAVIVAGGGITAAVFLSSDKDALPVDNSVSSAAADDSSTDSALPAEDIEASTATTTVTKAEDSLPEEMTTTTAAAPDESTAETEKPAETTATEAPVTTAKPAAEATDKTTTTTKAPAKTTTTTTTAKATTTAKPAAAAPKIVESGKCGNNVNYTIDENGLLTISGTGKMYDYDIDTSPFYQSVTIEKVVISNGVTNVGANAFQECWCLTSVSLSNTVTSIGKYAFYRCAEITNVTLPSSVKTIEMGAFNYCTGITKINIPNGVTKIEDDTFYFCSSLTSITIPDSVTSIGLDSFQFCLALKSVTLPNSVTTLKAHSFYGCESLTSVTIPNSVSTIEYETFYGCTSLKSVTVPASVKSIGEKAFGYYAIDFTILKDEDFILKGKTGSAAEQYAKDNGIKFTAI